MSATTRLVHRYLDRVVAATTHDPDIADTYIQVLGLLAHPTSLLAPRVLAAAARARPETDSAPAEAPPPTRPLTPSAR